jgi:hypothetical protein
VLGPDREENAPRSLAIGGARSERRAGLCPGWDLGVSSGRITA